MTIPEKIILAIVFLSTFVFFVYAGAKVSNEAPSEQELLVIPSFPVTSTTTTVLVTTTVPITTTTLLQETTTLPPPPATMITLAPNSPLNVGFVNGYPCGGVLPPCRVLRCESGGNPKAENPNSTASGLWQFLDSTWDNFGGYSRASQAPVHMQNAKAAILWDDGKGASHWAQCL